MIKHDPLKFAVARLGPHQPDRQGLLQGADAEAPRDRMNAKDAMHHPWIKERSTVHQGETAATAMRSTRTCATRSRRSRRPR